MDAVIVVGVNADVVLLSTYIKHHLAPPLTHGHSNLGAENYWPESYGLMDGIQKYQVQYVVYKAVAAWERTTKICHQFVPCFWASLNYM